MRRWSAGQWRIDAFGKVTAGRLVGVPQLKRRGDLAADKHLPAATRLWAALQQVGGGTWGGCVYDVDLIAEKRARS